MKKSKINYFIDLLMLISFVINSITGLILFFFLPTGVRGEGYQVFLGIMKQNWINLHNRSGLLLILLVAIHLILHWDWIVSMTKSLRQKNNQ